MRNQRLDYYAIISAAVQVTIIGLGLIGGSLGLALKRSRWRGAQIVGYTRSQDSASMALERGAVVSVSPTLQGAVKDGDIIIVATPVLTVRDVLRQIAPVVKHGAILTDTGSTKSQVIQWAKELLPPYVNFIGGHPMAGKEASGIEAADAELFQGCVYCLSPEERATRESLNTIEDMVTAIGAVPITIDPEEHDKLVAGISHVPMLLSVALVLATTQNPAWGKMSRLAATGYRDVTRLASGSPEMHADICLTNKDHIVTWIDTLIAELQKLRLAVSQGDIHIRDILALAKQARQKWLEMRSLGK